MFLGVSQNSQMFGVEDALKTTHLALGLFFHTNNSRMYFLAGSGAALVRKGWQVIAEVTRWSFFLAPWGGKRRCFR